MIRPIAHALQKIGFGKRVTRIVRYIEPVRVIVETVHRQIWVEYSATCLSRVTLRFQ